MRNELDARIYGFRNTWPLQSKVELVKGTTRLANYCLTRVDVLEGEMMTKEEWQSQRLRC